MLISTANVQRSHREALSSSPVHTENREDFMNVFAAYCRKKDIPMVCAAAWLNNLRVLEGLVEQVNNEQMVAGYGPLHFAAALGNLDIVEFLLENGVDKNLRDKDGNTALMWVIASDKKTEIMEALVDHGASLNAQNFAGETALSIAVKFGLTEKVRYLLNSGASPNTANLEGSSPLHIASGRGDEEMMMLLIRYGAHVNATDDEGDSALHYAVREGHLNAVRLLCKCGANVAHKNDDGEDPLEFAICFGEERIAQQLRTMPIQLIGTKPTSHSSYAGSYGKHIGDVLEQFPYLSVCEDSFLNTTNGSFLNLNTVF
eukprot:CAMPEP_0174262352 /NCGR_PEP_ID=MMETSP0439-20130205/12924_1 /TAXON_ID=0 /ORGANISM="Stereomyxa ramosa, Strain Chinc5" /LENGTH=315 /DNA_ID=CAMNT_0015347047 /DNA_START=80 /DNA_END=1027 /DNA_ORIENTATION=+